MKILVINAGSSSLKFQLIDMENEQVIAKGICEEIGGKSGFKFKVPGREDYKAAIAMPTHAEALELVCKIVRRLNGTAFHSFGGYYFKARDTVFYQRKLFLFPFLKQFRCFHHAPPFSFH